MAFDVLFFACFHCVARAVAFAVRGSFIGDRLEFERLQARFPGAVVSVMFWGVCKNAGKLRNH